jgi:hypothetical protein
MFSLYVDLDLGKGSNVEFVSHAKGRAHTGGMGIGRKTQNLKVFDAPTAEELTHNLKATEANMER